MAITKEKKRKIVSDLEKLIKSSKSVVFVNFKGLPVKETSEMRRVLKGEKITYTVTKKSLFDRVLGAVDLKGEKPKLLGELALAFGEDLIAPARGIYDFQKKFDGKIKIVGGIFDGEYKSPDEMVGIASIPSLQVLRGMFVNIINSPIQRFAVLLNEIAKLRV